MEIIKRNIKLIIAFLMGLTISGTTVVIAYSVLATNIGYTPSDSTWKKLNGDNINNVKDAIDSLYLKANSNARNITFDNTNRASYTITENVEEAYLFISHGTGEFPLSFSITGDILISSSHVSSSTAVDNYGAYLRATLDVYKLNLNGNQGTISITANGGTNSFRAWTSIIAY